MTTLIHETQTIDGGTITGDYVVASDFTGGPYFHITDHAEIAGGFTIVGRRDGSWHHAIQVDRGVDLIARDGPKHFHNIPGWCIKAEGAGRYDIRRIQSSSVFGTVFIDCIESETVPSLTPHVARIVCDSTVHPITGGPGSNVVTIINSRGATVRRIRGIYCKAALKLGEGFDGALVQTIEGPMFEISHYADDTPQWVRVEDLALYQSWRHPELLGQLALFQGPLRGVVNQARFFASSTPDQFGVNLQSVVDPNWEANGAQNDNDNKSPDMAPRLEFRNSHWSGWGANWKPGLPSYPLILDLHVPKPLGLFESNAFSGTVGPHRLVATPGGGRKWVEVKDD